ncbi:MAG: FtsX-like permease family protein [Bacteroidetes bacterium]|nr:FtsX-like permease family protein [Bacteroidota bacterium]
MRTFGVHKGDSVQIGRHSYEIAGSLLRAPSETEISMFVMPSVYVPMETLDTLLLGFGAMANYEVYVKLNSGEDPEVIRESLNEDRSGFNANIDTIEEQRQNWGEALSFFNQFLGLAGFGALVLGGFGVGGAIRAHVRRSLDNIAVLQCLGAGSGKVFSVYFLQALILGCVAGVLGCIGGVLSQLLIPYAISAFLPFEIAFRVSWPSMVMGFGVGLSVTLIFATLPLLDVRGVSPLRALRSNIEPLTPARVRFLAYIFITGGLVVIAAAQSGSWIASAYYALGIIVAFGSLVLVAKLLMLIARRVTNRIASYPVRQGFANLHRPGNQTILVMLALGLATFIVMVLLISENTIVQQINRVGGEGRPDMIFFDIQNDQLGGVTKLIEEQRWPIIDSSPIVNMRLHAIGERTVEELVKDSTRGLSWPLTREYRSTYRSELTDAETLAGGTFAGIHHPDSSFVPISIEYDFARTELGLDMGDTLVFNVQGKLIPTRITSFRAVEWEQMRANFYVVFPINVLENVPQTHMITSRSDSNIHSDSLQSLVVANYPNVTVLSLEAIIQIIREVFNRIRFAIQFMAYFCFIAGILVLIGALLIGRLQRIEESGLLKTLGASREQLLIIGLAEYSVLGFLASAAGLLLSLIAGWILSLTVFEVSMAVSVQSILAVIVTVVGVTVTTGFLSNRSVYDRSVLAVLRAEG